MNEQQQRTMMGLDHRERGMLLFWPVIVFAVVAAGTLWTYRHARNAELAHAQHHASLVLPGIAERIELRLHDDARPIRRLARDVSNGTIRTPEAFESAVQAVHSVVPSWHSIAWLHAELGVRSVSVRDGKRRNPDGSGSWRKALHAPKQHVSVSRTVEGSTLVLSIGAWPLDSRPDTRSVIVAETTLADALADAVAEDNQSSFAISLYDEQDNELFTTRAPTNAEFRIDQPLRVLDLRWRIELAPTDAFMAAQLTRRPQAALAVGIGIATLASVATAFSILRLRAVAARTAARFRALHAMTQLSASSHSAHDDQIVLLHQLSRLGSRLMLMPVRVVALYDTDGRSLRVVVHEGLRGDDARRLAQTFADPASSNALQMLGATDLDSLPHDFRPHGIRSLMLLPLTVRNEPLGVVLLAAPGGRNFSAIDHKLAKIWIAEASAILTHFQTYERMQADRRSLERLISQRDALFQVNNMIQSASSVREALDRLAERAPQALEVDACVVCLAHSERGSIKIAAVSRTDFASGMLPDRVVECPVCATVIEGGDVLILDDTQKVPIRGFPDMGSALYVPMKSGSETKGLLCLLRYEKGTFEREHVEIAKVFAARATAAVETARLNEQTRRQAETNAILLRELNHRVGNNLASIVGLLSFASAKLPEASRQWLDRVIERVTMMARAHDLFSSGAHSVALDDLVRATLASVCAAKGAEVRITLDLDGAAIDIDSTRAVTLAMVLHELAYNAMVHALNDGGDLIIRGRRLSDRFMTIDVIDEPSALGAPLVRRINGDAAQDEFAAVSEGNENDNANDDGHEHGQSSGIGLQLVRSLVRRELRGRFTMVKTARGGTVASIELPVEVPTALGSLS